jgi:hypothetical protein
VVKVTRDSKEDLVPQGPLSKEMVVIKDLLEIQGHKDLREMLILDQRETQDLQAQLHQKVLRVTKVPRVSKVIKVSKGPLVLRVTKVLRVIKVSKVIKV